MSTRAAFLLLVEILLSKVELVYLLLNDPISYTFPLRYCLVYYLYDLIVRYWYKFEGIDDLGHLILFGLTGLFFCIHLKVFACHLIVWTLLAISTRFCSI